MKDDNPPFGGPRGQGENQGEGDKASARRYNRQVREFIAEGRVDPAAQGARQFVERAPEDAERAEQEARRGPKGGTRVSVDELVAKGRSLLDRVRPRVERLVSRARSRFGRK